MTLHDPPNRFGRGVAYRSGATVGAPSTCSVVRAVGSGVGMVGADQSITGAVAQAAVVRSVTSFQVVKRTAISRRYSSARGR